MMLPKRLMSTDCRGGSVAQRSSSSRQAVTLRLRDGSSRAPAETDRHPQPSTARGSKTTHRDKSHARQDAGNIPVGRSHVGQEA
jgi:hypothetical protein